MLCAPCVTPHIVPITAACGIFPRWTAVNALASGVMGLSWLFFTAYIEQEQEISHTQTPMQTLGNHAITRGVFRRALCVCFGPRDDFPGFVF